MCAENLFCMFLNCFCLVMKIALFACFALNVMLEEIFISFYEFVPAAQLAAFVPHSS